VHGLLSAGAHGYHLKNQPLSDLRLAVERALRRLNMTAMRYPGGNFASGYHWLDGVGPRASRPTARELTGLPPITPDSLEWFAQMAALPIPNCDLDALKRRLYDEFHIEIPTVEWNSRHFPHLDSGVQHARRC